jgi:hypothetical protein
MTGILALILLRLFTEKDIFWEVVKENWGYNLTMCLMALAIEIPTIMMALNS